MICSHASTVILATLRAVTSRPLEPQMDTLMVFGFISGFLALVFFIYQHESRRMMRALAVSLVAMAAYGFMQGAWPMGLVVAVWSAATFWKTFTKERLHDTRGRVARRRVMGPRSLFESESRISRLFGPS